MKEYFSYKNRNLNIIAWCKHIKDAKVTGEVKPETTNLPLPNLWLGVSVENQEQVDKRIPYLLETPAKIRFLSVEPLLGEINFTYNNIEIGDDFYAEEYEYNVLSGIEVYVTIEGVNRFPRKVVKEKIDWVIVGGESGKDARPMHPDWVRSIRNQCQEAGVPFFFKQWGEWHPSPKYLTSISGLLHNYDRDKVFEYPKQYNRKLIQEDELPDSGFINCPLGTLVYERDKNEVRLLQKLGKKAAGALLDGVEYKEFPILD